MPSAHGVCRRQSFGDRLRKNLDTLENKTCVIGVAPFAIASGTEFFKWNEALPRPRRHDAVIVYHLLPLTNLRTFDRLVVEPNPCAEDFGFVATVVWPHIILNSDHEHFCSWNEIRFDRRTVPVRQHQNIKLIHSLLK
jgi:hypothetical protein